MKKLLLRIIIYYALIITFCYFFNFAILNPIGYGFIAIVLCILNLVLRPLFNAIALALGTITFNIPLLFVNVATLYLANLICLSPIRVSFLLMMLLSLLIFIADRILNKATESKNPELEKGTVST